MNMIEKALQYAADAHAGQTRKGSPLPYILHPMEAAVIASTVTVDPEIIAAVILHDTVEDTEVTAEDIRRDFGDRVARIVAGDTENTRDDLPRDETWRIRKEESLEKLRQSDRDVKIMWLSDKLSNIRSLCRMYCREGDAMWEHFHMKDKKVQEWYYRTIADYLAEFRDTEAYQEYVGRLNIMFGEVGG